MNSPDESDAEAFDSDARRLIELSHRLDEPFRPAPHLIYLTLMAVRSRSLFSAVLGCTSGAAAAAAGPLLRALTEANIAIRFVCEGDTELLLDLWDGERERGRLNLDDRLRRLAKLSGRWRPLLTDEQRAEIQAAVSDARSRAREAGVPGVGDRGAVFPSTANQVDYLKSEQVLESYAVAYGPLSDDVHLGAGSFDHVTVDQGSDGLIHVSDAVSAETVRAQQHLGLVVFASTLVMADHNRGLGIKHVADEIKRRYIPHERPLDERSPT